MESHVVHCDSDSDKETGYARHAPRPILKVERVRDKEETTWAPFRTTSFGGSP